MRPFIGLLGVALLAALPARAGELDADFRAAAPAASILAVEPGLAPTLDATAPLPDGWMPGELDSENPTQAWCSWGWRRGWGIGWGGWGWGGGIGWGGGWGGWGGGWGGWGYRPWGGFVSTSILVGRPWGWGGGWGGWGGGWGGCYW